MGKVVLGALDLVLCALFFRFLVFGFWSIDGERQNCKATSTSVPPAIAGGSVVTITVKGLAQS